MSEIQYALDHLEGTSEYDVLIQMDAVYGRITAEQSVWYDRSHFMCTYGCGECCVHFEPDLLESEALYMAAWLISNQHDTALKVADGSFPYDNGTFCLFYNPDSAYHCSIYGGRPGICRLFGASCSLSKDGHKVWKPCRFYPFGILMRHDPPIEHRQYNEDEILDLFGTLPPSMSDLMQEAVAAHPGSQETALIRDILPGTIRRLLWIMNMNGNNNPNDTPTPHAA